MAELPEAASNFTVTGSLDDLRVVEIGDMVAAPYAAKLLADLGAHVIKVEPPDGDRARRVGPFPPGSEGDIEQSGLFLGLNTNKQSIVLDLSTGAGQDRLATLIDDCDVLIHGLTPARASELGLDADSLLDARPELVICAITAFGHIGPQAEWAGEELNVVHGGGWGYLIPGDAVDPTSTPLTVHGHPATTQAAMAASFATLGAVYKARESGIGDFIDMSVTAHVASMLEASFIAWSYLGKVAQRSEGRLLNPWGIFPCSDGLIFLVTVEQDQWLRLVDMMGRPEWGTTRRVRHLRGPGRQPRPAHDLHRGMDSRTHGRRTVPRGPTTTHLLCARVHHGRPGRTTSLGRTWIL